MLWPSEADRGGLEMGLKNCERRRERVEEGRGKREEREEEEEN